MTSQLKQTRANKQAMLKGMNNDIFDLLCYKKGRLDKLDFRVLKDIAKKLNEAKDRANPDFNSTNKNVSSVQRKKMP